MEQDFEIYTYPSLEQHLEGFLDNYNMISLVIPPEESIRGFKKRNERVCRFCKSPAGEKKFSKIAHIIPEFMGNKYLQSDFECDDCNSHFSKYETDLAAWLGMYRTVLGIKGKNGVPTFKSHKELITAKLIDFINIKATKISSPILNNEVIKVDKKTGSTVITYTKESYTPINVYKALLKIALSIIGVDEIEEYRFALNYLLNDSPNNWCDEFAKVMVHMLPMNHGANKPFSILFKKNCPESKIPMHSLMLYFGTYVFAFPLPFNKLDCDKGLYNDLKMAFNFPPPILFNRPTQNSNSLSRILNFYNYEKIVGEESEIRFQVNPNDLKNNVIIDPETGVTIRGSLDENNITAVVFAPKGSVLKIDEIKP